MADHGGWRNRIVGHGELAPDEFLANPRNFRVHPTFQQDAITGALGAVGWVQDVIVNRRTGRLVDGHARVALALRHGQDAVPVTWVDLSDEEEALVLATLDPIAALAGADAELLAALLAEIGEAEDAALRGVLAGLAEEAGLAGEAASGELPGAAAEPAAEDPEPGFRCQECGHHCQVGPR